MLLPVTSDAFNYSKYVLFLFLFFGGGVFEVVSSDYYLPKRRRSLVSCKRRVNSLLPLVPSLAGERVCQNSCWGKQGWENAFGKVGLPAEDPAQLQLGKRFSSCILFCLGYLLNGSKSFVLPPHHLTGHILQATEVHGVILICMSKQPV